MEREKLEKLYLDEKLSIRECAKVLGSTYGSVTWALKKHNIPRRSWSADKLNEKRVPPSGDSHPGWKGGKKKVVCESCGKVFYKFPSLIKKRNFCSKKCFHDSMKGSYIGKRFGMLTVVERAGRDKHNHLLWRCVCDCGNEKITASGHLSTGLVISCGCARGRKGKDSPHWKRVKTKCPVCGKSFLIQPYRLKLYKGATCSKDCRSKQITISRSGKNSPKWKYGTVGFDTYSVQLAFAEKVRRDPENEDLLNVKCAYCGRWYRPTPTQVAGRIEALYGKRNRESSGEHRFYCSDGCKKACPIYRKIRWPAGFKVNTSREVVPELRQIVFERDEYRCQKCDSDKELHCHHIKGYTQNKIFANDPDNCITLCKKCHKEVHKDKDCTYLALRCDKARSNPGNQ